MSDANITAWLVGIAGLLAALFAGLKSILDSRAKARLEEQTVQVKVKQEQQAREFSESQIILDRQEKHIARLEVQIDEHQKAILDLYAWCLKKDVDYDTLKSWGLEMVDIGEEQNQVLKAAGLPTRDIPRMPARGPRTEGANDPGWIMRTAAQDAKVATEATRIIEAAAAEKKK